jgi:hypothetical protein
MSSNGRIKLTDFCGEEKPRPNPPIFQLRNFLRDSASEEGVARPFSKTAFLVWAEALEAENHMLGDSLALIGQMEAVIDRMTDHVFESQRHLIDPMRGVDDSDLKALKWELDEAEALVENFRAVPDGKGTEEYDQSPPILGHDDSDPPEHEQNT